MPKRENDAKFVATIEAQLRDQATWEDLDADEQLKLLANGVGLYGGTCEPELVKLLVPLYISVRERTSAEDRTRLLDEVRHAVNNGIFSFNALLPFLLLDDTVGIVSTAALDLAMFQPGGNDGLDGVRNIIGHIERGEVDNRGAAFGGLLLLGDERVCILLTPLRERLNDNEVKVAVVECSRGYAYTAVIEFLLEWLELIEGDMDDGRYGDIASALYLMPQRMQAPNVVSVRRHLGESNQWKRVELLKEYSVKEMANRLENRLYALESREPPPKVSSAILRAWGLKPRAPRDQQAVRDQ